MNAQRGQQTSTTAVIGRPDTETATDRPETAHKPVGSTRGETCCGESLASPVETQTDAARAAGLDLCPDCFEGGADR